VCEIFLPEFSQTYPKGFCATFAQKGLRVFFCKGWAPLQRWAPFLPGLSWNLSRFLGTLREFLQILPRFSDILSDCEQIKTFGGALASPVTLPLIPLIYNVRKLIF